MLIASTAAAIAALAVTTPWWPRRIGDRAEARTTVALSLAYLANASQCLAWFGDARDLGWWLTLAGSIALVAELVWIAIAARRSTR